jgi:hypothetical protein
MFKELFEFMDSCKGDSSDHQRLQNDKKLAPVAEFFSGSGFCLFSVIAKIVAQRRLRPG